jgi:hypothetical protein
VVCHPTDESPVPYFERLCHALDHGKKRVWGCPYSSVSKGNVLVEEPLILILPNQAHPNPNARAHMLWDFGGTMFVANK